MAEFFDGRKQSQIPYFSPEELIVVEVASFMVCR